MKVYGFQSEAINLLKKEVLCLLEHKVDRELHLNSPTGSGKTFMLAKIIEGVAKEAKNTCFIWTAPNKLHSQALNKLQKIFSEDKVVDCEDLTKGTTRTLEKNRVYFINHSSLDKETNTINKENETETSLPQLIKKAKDSGLRIILIVDENHLAQGPTNKLRMYIEEEIKPEVLLGATATPNYNVGDHRHHSIKVKYEDVVNSGLIRKKVVINPTSAGAYSLINNKLESKAGSLEELIAEAVELRERLHTSFKEVKSTINPLILFQIPNEKDNERADNSEDKRLKQQVQDILKSKYGWSPETGEVAIYLTKEKTVENLEDLSLADHSVKALIFKVGIATGWDCPRAQILVGLREMHSKNLKVQVFGRILRQPLGRHFDLEYDELNYGYLIANIPSLQIKSEQFEQFESYLGIPQKARYSISLPLPSEKKVTSDERIRLGKPFLIKFLELAASKNKVLHHRGPLFVERLLDGEATMLDADTNRSIKGSTKSREKTLEELKEEFEMLATRWLQGTADQNTGRGFIKEALRKSYPVEAGEDNEKHQLETLLHPENQKILDRLLYDTIDALGGYSTGNSEYWEKINFLVLPKERARKIDEKYSFSKYLYEPCFKSELSSTPEQLFGAYLETIPSVLWWVKLDENDKDCLRIRYPQDGGDGEFRPDFLVQFESGRIGIYDTKAGNTAETAHGKANALQRYCDLLRKEGVDVHGGIIVFAAEQPKINRQPQYSYDKKLKEPDWEWFDEVIDEGGYKSQNLGPAN